ncbi:YciI family protein [Paenibacillus sp. BSR1-1]|uniref:YciI family protein n=1 Tax=Paenibacillus sp. BSR1-1 TaxID=3020845 RepID=UPI0025AF5647|nr:YciI family protein [Paenibacillus sp. BSR1-1]MDN3015350.1 YciI family protein [Paenibacillus sp. BSR1-1]
MEEFVYLIRPNRADFIESMTNEESIIMADHFEYLKQLLAKEKLILAGPCLDGAFGICVFKEDSWENAEKVMMNDPAVSNGIMSSELHKYRVSLMQEK